MVKTIKSPVNMEITDGQRTKVVHVNRFQHRVQWLCKEIPDIPAADTQIWEPPWAELHTLPRLMLLLLLPPSDIIHYETGYHPAD